MGEDARTWDTRRRRDFGARLLRWYGAHRRDLPWRRRPDAYRVWVSEVMLQQTRVAVVVEYFQRFLRRFPTVAALARARPAAVLAEWSGLGYYRRARALQRAARQIARAGGRLPATAAEWRELPGIGRYTAAAIASIAGGERCAVVDGNVARVLGRLLGRRLRGEDAWRCAEELLSPRHPGDFNQAMMELGATVCLPAAPNCAACPVARFCATFETARPPARTARPAPREKRRVAYRLAVRGNAVLLARRRDDHRLMPGMWELPEAPLPRDDASAALRLRHSITTTDYDVLVLRQNGNSASGGVWVARARLAQLPLTGLARKVLRAAGLLD